MTIMTHDSEHDRADGVVLTAEQKRRQRARSVAIALALGALVVLFFALTIVKVGNHPWRP